MKEGGREETSGEQLENKWKEKGTCRLSEDRECRVYLFT